MELGHKHNLGHPVVVSLYLDLFLMHWGGGVLVWDICSPQPVICLLSVFTLTTEPPLYHQNQSAWSVVSVGDAVGVLPVHADPPVEEL